MKVHTVGRGDRAPPMKFCAVAPRFAVEVALRNEILRSRSSFRRGGIQLRIAEM